MQRRDFVRLLAGAPLGGTLAGALQVRPDAPTVRVVSSFAAAKFPGMPGPYPGRVVSVTSEKCVDTSTGQANDEVVREMLARGMRALTGAGDDA